MCVACFCKDDSDDPLAAVQAQHHARGLALDAPPIGHQERTAREPGNIELLDAGSWYPAEGRACVDEQVDVGRAARIRWMSDGCADGELPYESDPALFLTQSTTILRELRKATQWLNALQRALGTPSRGPGRTRAAVEKDIREMLHARHLKELVRVTLTDSPTLALHYEVDQAAWTHLQETLLGKNVLFTDQDGWPDEEIVRAYRSQYHIEDAFKRMKDPHFVSWRPLHHWTDQKIRVHAFYYVLALLLTALLRRALAHQQITLSITQILETLSHIKEVALVYPGRAREPQITYSRLMRLQRQLIAALKLARFQQP